MLFYLSQEILVISISNLECTRFSFERRITTDQITESELFHDLFYKNVSTYIYNNESLLMNSMSGAYLLWLNLLLIGEFKAAIKHLFDIDREKFWRKFLESYHHGKSVVLKNDNCNIASCTRKHFLKENNPKFIAI